MPHDSFATAAHERFKGRRQGAGILLSALLHAALLAIIVLVSFSPAQQPSSFKSIPVTLANLPATLSSSVLGLGKQPPVPSQPIARLARPSPTAYTFLPISAPHAPSPLRSRSQMQVVGGATGSSGAALRSSSRQATQVDLNAELEALAAAQAKQAATPRNADSSATLDLSSTSPSDDNGVGDPVHGLDGAKDFIRAQIERHWYPQEAELVRRDIAVTIRLALKSDGTVVRADIVYDAGSAADAVYRSLASSARNAALVSSPLALPKGVYAPITTVSLQFDTASLAR
jgi:hypothetical protein